MSESSHIPPRGTPNWVPGVPAPAEEDVVKCVSCGLCLPHCPTFRVTGRETAAPRGRILAMRAVGEGRAEVDDTFATMMDECLACRACETACPSAVPFGRMIEAARAQAETVRPLPERAARKAGIGVVLSHPRAIALAGIGLAVSQALRVDRLLPPRLGGTAPRVSLRGLLRPIPKERGAGPVAAVLTGCVMDVAYRDVQAATMRAVAGAGFRAVRGAPRACCGALAMHHGQPEAAKHLARQRIAEFANADIVVANAAGCSNHMKTWGHLLADDPVWAEPAARVAAKVRDLLELDLHPTRTHAGAIAVHDACHHCNGQDMRAPLRKVLRDAGARPVEIPDDGRCCGAAGLYSVLQPELSGELRTQKARAIAATGATVVAVANPGCAIQIQNGLNEIGSPTRVVHPAQLL
ncbi:MAG: heterodisulfide reductase-related iron-sulfur binding cluster [Thermoleophilia bacterium]